MMRKLLVTAASAALLATPAAAATITVNHGAVTAIPGNNNFQTELNTALQADYVTTASQLILSGPAKIKFEFMGSESGFSDTFTFFADSVLGSSSLTEVSTGVINNFGAPVLIGIGTFNAGGDLINKLRFTSNAGVTADVGDDGFGVFLPANAVSGAQYTTLYLGYDDQVNNQDDNHDDFIVRLTVSAVPEPATWAMMIGGFGLVGAAMRRRSGSRRTVTA